MSENKRLHPAAIIFNLFKTIKEAIFPIAASWLLALKNVTSIYFILAFAVIAAIIVLFSFLSWNRYTYRIEEEELRIEYGVFIRKKRFISKNRIQSIDLTQGVIHRIFKLVKVEIETAGSGAGAEGSLKAVKLREGERVRDELKNRNQHDAKPTEEEASQNSTTKITSKRLFLAGTTSGSIGVILALLAFIFSQLEQFIPEHFYDNTYQTIANLSITIIAILIIIVLVLLWLFGIAGTMIKYGKFTITKKGDELFITRGLLEKKQLTIPLRRIQAIGIDESIIRQPFGYATVYAEVAGGSLDKGEDYSVVLFPILKKSEIDSFLQMYLPAYVIETDQLTPLPKRARKFYLLRSIIPIIAIAAGLLFFLPQFGWVSLILFVISLYLGFLRFQDGGFRIDGKRLTIRYRALNRNTVVIFHKRIQAFEKRQHCIQEKQKLATTKLSIVSVLGSGKHYRLKDLQNEHVNDIADWYSYR